MLFSKGPRKTNRIGFMMRYKNVPQGFLFVYYDIQYAAERTKSSKLCIEVILRYYYTKFRTFSQNYPQRFFGGFLRKIRLK